MSRSLGTIYRELAAENIFVIRTIPSGTMTVDWARTPKDLSEAHFLLLENAFQEISKLLSGKKHKGGSVTKVALWLAEKYATRCSDLAAAQEVN